MPPCAKTIIKHSFQLHISSLLKGDAINQPSLSGGLTGHDKVLYEIVRGVSLMVLLRRTWQDCKSLIESVRAGLRTCRGQGRKGSAGRGPDLWRLQSRAVSNLGKFSLRLSDSVTAARSRQVDGVAQRARFIKADFFCACTSYLSDWRRSDYEVCFLV